MLQSRVNADHLRIRFCMHQARKSVTGLAADTFAGARVAFRQLNAERHVERLQPQTNEVLVELLHSRFMADRRIWVRSARRRFGWIGSARAVNLVKLFGLQIERF